MKIAVFDLDGTLWKPNSHTDIINQYYGIRLSDNIFVKLCRRIFPNLYMHYINFLFAKIPDKYVQKYKPDVNLEIVALLNKLKSEQYRVMIISNAPKRLIKNACVRFDVEGMYAPIGEKNEIIQKMTYEYLIVVSDNITDINLMEMADKTYVKINDKNFCFFKKHFINCMEFYI